MNRFTRAALSALLGSTALMAFSAASAQTAGEITDEIVVRGARIPDEKRATSEITSVLDEESFLRTGDSDIGAALSRVTGLSLSQGKYVIVRGLNERYSSVTINGSPLPSPEPLQRVAPLDIIPTSILAGSLVQKTYSAEYSAEFGGGTIDLRTKSVPSEPFFSIGGSIGMDTATTGRNGFMYDGGDRDWLGFDDGTRNTPAALAAIFATGDINANNQAAIDTSLDEFKTLVVTENQIAPNYSFDMSGGHGFELNDTIAVGATFAAGISSDWQTRDGRREQGLISSGTFGNEGQVFDFISTSNKVETNGIATIGVNVGDNHEFTFTNFMLRSTIKEARISEGTNGDSGVDFFRQNTEFFERQVWQTQARGDHVFPALGDLSAKWRFAYGEAFRDSPYTRVNSYVDNGAGAYVYDSSRISDTLANTVAFSKINDENIDAGIDFVLPFDVAGGSHTFKFGYASTEKDRSTYLRLFRYAGPLAPELIGSRLDVIYSDPVMETNLLDLQLVQGSFFHDNTDSDLQVQGAYAGVDVELGPYVRLAAGGRYEDGHESTTSFATTFANSWTKTTIDEDYWLPAATLTWNPAGDLQVRAGYSQTITRPQFRELAPAFFVDEDTDLLLIGNPFLKNSELDNYDLRAEYYFSRGQFVTLGGFYKEITNPIEDAFLLQAGGLPISSYINAPSAKLYGFEFEFEKNFVLADMVDWSIFSTKDLVVKTNYTFSESEVSDDGVVITGAPDGVTQRIVPIANPASNYVVDGRSLQGQSKHIINFQIGLEDVENNSRATILVNWSSDRIRNVESFRSGVVAPAVVEEPPLLIDFVWSRGFEKWGGNWELGLKVRNILGDDYEATQTFADGTTAIFDSYRMGRDISVSLKRDF
ncbi:MAG TPA: TonB-dependent receptor [Parvularculaceae bacterium]|nr:TonB-dependent receptor [Parvularculaceae bacterium]